MDLKIYITIIAALTTTAAACLIAILAAPFIKPLVWALIIGVATIPYYRKIVRRIPHNPNCSAGLMILFITLCLVLPITALVVVIAQNSTDWMKESEQLVRSLTSAKTSGFFSHIPLVNKVVALIDKIGIDLTGYAAKLAAGASQFLVDGATNAAKNLADLFFTLALALFTLFFIYRDGDGIIAAGVARLEDKQEAARYYLSEIRSTTTAVVVGTLFTCFMQGALAGLGYYVAGTPLPILYGVLTGVAGLVPLIGTAVIWLPLVAFVAFGGAYLHALLLAIWCLIVVIAVTDNVIRPLAIGATSNKIPTLAVVLGAVGGVMAIGLLGLILGPIIFALLSMVWRDVMDTRQI